MTINYVVRTVSWSPERAQNIQIMKTHIPNLLVEVDTVGDWYASFFRVCEYINETGAVLLEDDVQLCRNFTLRIESIITEKGVDKVISFFEKPKVDLPTAYVGGSNFLWMQCIYLPPGLPSRMIGYFDEFKQTRPKRFRGLSVDSFVSFCLVKEKLKYWRIRPCLVQHLDFKSLGGHASGRQTDFFIDDLEGAI